MLTVEKTTVFYAAHSVKCFGAEHKCSRKHGHSYTVTVWASTSLENPLEFTKLEEAMAGLLWKWDHNDLNEVYPEDDPTVEFLCCKLAGHLLYHKVPVKKIRIQETQSSAVVWQDRCDTY
jgi:6-pyruvoyltetrahydropterin/6-carboxytetrahydropterin synthase